MKWKEIESLCLRLRIGQTQCLDALTLDGPVIISDHCIKLEDISDADVPYAIAFLKGRFAPEELFI